MFRHVIASIGLVSFLTIGPSPAPSPPAPQPTTTSFEDGGVTMSVGDVDCDHPSPSGEDCHVTVHVVNISDGFPVFTEADQTVYDPSGVAFHPDPVATAVANHGRSVTQRLPRGPAVTTVLVFAMPAGDRIDRIELHGKTGTPGETFIVQPR